MRVAEVTAQYPAVPKITAPSRSSPSLALTVRAPPVTASMPAPSTDTAISPQAETCAVVTRAGIAREARSRSDMPATVTSTNSEAA